MTIDLDAALALCDAATAGPWTKPTSMHHVVWQNEGHTREIQIRHALEKTGWSVKADAEFLASARTLVPELIAELREARDQLRVARAERKEAWDGHDRLNGEAHLWRGQCDRARDERDALQKECERLATRLDDVLALHGREGTFRGLHDENMFCVACGSAWPCPTVRAATGDA